MKGEETEQIGVVGDVGKGVEGGDTEGFGDEAEGERGEAAVGAGGGRAVEVEKKEVGVGGRGGEETSETIGEGEGGRGDGEI